MANIAEKVGLKTEVMELKLGKSFEDSGYSCWNTIRYDFKPASVDTKKTATVDIGEGNQVTVTVPHIEGSGTAQTVFKGSKKPYQKECVLVIDHDTGEITLEKLSCNVQLKKTRAEGNPRHKSFTPMYYFLSKKSPPQKKSPKLWPSSNHHFPVQKCSPLPRSPPNCNQQLSPTTHTSPSMPCLVPPNNNSKHSMSTPQEASVNCVSVGENIAEHIKEPEVDVLSSSDSTDSSSNSSSSQESSDAEGEDKVSKKPSWLQVPVHSGTAANSGTRSSTGSQPLSTNVLASMPKFSQLSEDLQLSESDSD